MIHEHSLSLVIALVSALLIGCSAADDDDVEFIAANPGS